MSDDWTSDAYRQARALPWEQLLTSFEQTVRRFTVDRDGTAWLAMSEWAVAEMLAYEVMRRTEEPNTVREALLRRLAQLTMVLVAVIRDGCDHLVALTRDWVLARGELMALDVSVTASTPVAPEPGEVAAHPAREALPRDPLHDSVDVQNGYRFFYDGRPPEPA